MQAYHGAGQAWPLSCRDGSGNVDGRVERKPLILQAIESEQDQPTPAETTTPGRIRTYDPRFRKPMLYPLSYGGDTDTRLSR